MLFMSHKKFIKWQKSNWDSIVKCEFNENSFQSIIHFERELYQLINSNVNKQSSAVVLSLHSSEVPIFFRICPHNRRTYSQIFATLYNEQEG